MAAVQIIVWVLQLLVYDTANTVALEMHGQSFITARVGDSIVLSCSKDGGEVGKRIIWYKQGLAKTSAELQKEDKVDGRNNLRIRKVETSDSGVYQCMAQNLALKIITVIVIDEVLIEQPALGMSRDGHFVNLTCVFHAWSYRSQARVYWFRESDDFTGTYNSSLCDCDMNAPTKSCVSRLPVHKVSLEQVTFHCAVVTSGRILFGNGTKLRIQDKDGEIYDVLAEALICSGILILGLALLLYIYKRKWNGLDAGKKKPVKTSKEQAKPSPSTGPKAKEPEADYLHYTEVKINPASKHGETVSTNCVYSTVKMQ